MAEHLTNQDFPDNQADRQGNYLAVCEKIDPVLHFQGGIKSQTSNRSLLVKRCPTGIEASE